MLASLVLRYRDDCRATETAIALGAKTREIGPETASLWPIEANTGIWSLEPLERKAVNRVPAFFVVDFREGVRIFRLHARIAGLPKVRGVCIGGHTST